MRLNIFVSITVLYVLFFCPSSIVAKARMATLSGNGFQGVLVSISSNIQATNKQEMDSIVSALKTLLTNASTELYVATENRAYFYTVDISIPSSWTAWSGSTSGSQLSAVDQSRYQKADIVVDVANAAYGNLPYVQQTRGCGEPGDFIHITKDFLYDNTLSPSYGPAGRLLAREWIKYYFGVFDEQGYDFNETYPVKYYTSSGQTALTSCSNSNVNYKTMSCSGTSSVAGLPNSCQMEVDTTAGANNNLTSSLMYLPIVPVARKVCNSSNHNSEAPNKQNVMCDGKSIMDVILRNSQFQNGANKPSTMATPPSNTPQFTTNQISPSAHIALYVVWDIVDNERNYYSAGPALSKFIERDLPSGSYFGFTVTEDPTSYKVFQPIENQNDRDNVISSISPSKSNFTGGDISVAVQTAVNNLKTLDKNTYYGSILITTNSTDATKWSSICSLVNNELLEIHLVTYLSSTVASYINAKCEGSQIIVKAVDQARYYGSNNIKLPQCYNQLQERQQIDRYLRTLPATILPNLYSPPLVSLDRFYYDSANDSFAIDSSSGTFYVETCQNMDPQQYDKLVRCNVGSPSTANSTACAPSDSHTHSICMNVPLSNANRWNFECQEIIVDNIVPYIATAIGIPKSNPTPDVNKQDILLNSWVVFDNPSSDYTRVRIFASLKKGTTPVLNAKVVATITSDSAVTLVNVTLRDDGNGNPDVTAQDGVYTAYFTQFGLSSAYSVNVRAVDNGTAAVPNAQYPWITHVNDLKLVSSGSFSREAPAGSFVDNSPLTGVDNIPPGRILDLRVQSSTSDSVTLAWTAPGNNLDFGTAKQYIIKCSTNRNEVTTPFEKNDQASNIPAIVPAVASTKQTVTLTGAVDGITRYCAIQTFDGRLYSSPSNTVSYVLVQSGLTGAQVAGISLGVIFGILAIVAVVILIYCCYCQKRKTKGPPPKNDPRHSDTKYDTIPQIGVQSDKEMVTYKASIKNENEQVPLQKSSVKQHGSNDSINSAGKKVSQAFPSPPPTQSSFDYADNSHPTPKMYGQPFNYSTLPVTRDDDDDNVLADSAEVAIPQVLTKTALIENTKRYQDSPKIPPKPAFNNEAPNYNKLFTNTSGYNSNSQV